MKSLSFVLVGTMVLAVIAVAGYANATFLPKDSADFAWKYEMDQDVSTVDLDNNGVMDFSIFSLNGGSGTYTVSGGNTVLSMSYPTPNLYYAPVGASSIWTSSGITSVAGYTIEIHAKIDSSTGVLGGMMVDAATVDANMGYAQLSVSATGQFWGAPAGYGQTPIGVSLGSADNTDGFHTFRIAQTPGTAVYSVWRDGVLLSDILPTANSSNGSKLLDFGAGSSLIHGASQVDYFRFTSGAWAPVPEPGTILLLATGLVGLLAYGWRKRK
jgi:hypothetical protein